MMANWQQRSHGSKYIVQEHWLYFHTVARLGPILGLHHFQTDTNGPSCLQINTCTIIVHLYTLDNFDCGIKGHGWLLEYYAASLASDCSVLNPTEPTMCTQQSYTRSQPNTYTHWLTGWRWYTSSNWNGLYTCTLHTLCVTAVRANAILCL